MENKPLLSICIPTRNREKYLKECIDSIINQEWFNEKEIEIVISDNASTDKTWQLIENYQKKYTNITYHRNKENIWAIKNILNLPNYAHGEYSWFLSDDDMLSSIWLKTTIEVIKEENPWLILSKFFWFWDWTKVDQRKIDREWKITNIIWMDHFFDFLAKVHYDITPYMMLLSLFCFKRDIYLKHINILCKDNKEWNMEKLYNDNFIHSRIIYIPFGNKEKITVIEKDLILCRWGNISWSPSRLVCKDLWKLVQDLNKIYKMNKKAYHKMKNIYYYSVFSYIVITHIRKYIPKFLYDGLVYIWRHLVKLIRKIKIACKL
jgi:abequosyltransferase